MNARIPQPVQPYMAPQNEARLLARRWTRDRTVAERRARLDAIVRFRGELTDEELLLLACCAYRKALKLDRRSDYLAVKQRLAAVGRRPDPPALVRELVDRLLVTPGDGSAFAEALLPHERDWAQANQADTGASAGGGGGVT